MDPTTRREFAFNNLSVLLADFFFNLPSSQYEINIETPGFDPNQEATSCLTLRAIRVIVKEIWHGLSFIF